MRLWDVNITILSEFSIMQFYSKCLETKLMCYLICVTYKMSCLTTCLFHHCPEISDVKQYLEAVIV